MFAAPVLLAISAVQAPAHVLPPKVAPDWEYRRLELPPSFAPGLGVRGFAEQRSAPGMRSPESELYSTFIVGVWIEGQVAVDAPFLKSFLEDYFGGLCRSAARATAPARDSAVSARVVANGPYFVASVEMCDLETGAPLSLRMEWAFGRYEASTELVGLASPAPGHADLWDDLRALRSTWILARPLRLLLRDVDIQVDSETFAALSGSDFLSGTFAVSSQRSAELSFYGDASWIAFSRSHGESQRGAHITLAIDKPGGTDLFASRLADARIPHRDDAFSGPWQRQIGGDSEFSFWRLRIDAAHPESRLRVSTSELDPYYMSTWAPHWGGPHATDLSRSRILDEHHAVFDPKGRHPRLFENVRAVHLALDEREREQIFAVFELAGFTLEQRGETAIWKGPAVRYVVRRAEGSSGVTKLELSLRGPLDRPPLTCGTVRLHFEGRAATLTLGR